MFHKAILLSFVLFFCITIKSQNVGIGTATPDSNAILELKSTNKGFMMPRMNTSQRDAIVTPNQGLQIYNTDDRCTDTYDGSKWSKKCDMKQNGNATLPANSWTQKADFGGTSRTSAVGFSIGNKGYIGTGLGGSLPFLKDFWEYNPVNNTWAQKADFGGTARRNAVGFSIGSKGYLGTGYDGTRKKDFWEYDAINNTWAQKADFTNTGREGAVGFSIGSKGYIGTGIDGIRKKDFWEYDPINDAWTQKADFGGSAREEAVGFSLGNKGYIGTGSDNNYKKDFWEFTPDPGGGGLGTWSQKTDFGGVGRYSAVGFSISNKGYIGTGWIGGTDVNDFWEYNAMTNEWIQKENFGSVERYDAVGFSLSNNGYVGTGYGGGFRKDFWEYNTLPISGKEYVENIPNDAVLYKGHDWTSSGNNLYTTKEDVNMQIRGNVIGELKFNNALSNRRVVLWDNENSNTNFFGFGINSYTLRYNVPNTVDRHTFFAGNSELLSIYGNATVVCEGPMWADSYNVNSDQSLKKNILPITSTLSSLLALNGYTYNWKDDKKEQTLQSGFLAQEVQKIYPHLVSTSEKGTLGVNYIGLMPMIIEAMKELNKVNENLRVKNNELEFKLDALESKINIITSEISKTKK